MNRYAAPSLLGAGSGSDARHLSGKGREGVTQSPTWSAGARQRPLLLAPRAVQVVDLPQDGLVGARMGPRLPKERYDLGLLLDGGEGAHEAGLVRNYACPLLP